MNRESRDNRHYKSSPLPTLVAIDEETHSDQNKETLAMLYNQVCSSWKTLVDVRFKLLGLVPAVSLGLLTTVLSNKSDALPASGKMLISLLGAVASLGIFIYDRRNSELHDDLISRGRKIEEELGIDTGIFRGRLNSSGIIKHDIATNTIYISTMIAWVAAIIFIIIAK